MVGFRLATVNEMKVLMIQAMGPVYATLYADIKYCRFLIHLHLGKVSIVKSSLAIIYLLRIYTD